MNVVGINIEQDVDFASRDIRLRHKGDLVLASFLKMFIRKMRQRTVEPYAATE